MMAPWRSSAFPMLLVLQLSYAFIVPTAWPRSCHRHHQPSPPSLSGMLPQQTDCRRSSTTTTVSMVGGWFQRGGGGGGVKGGASSSSAAAVLSPPLANVAQAKLDYAGILKQVAASVKASVSEGKRTITVDYPPDEGSTLVKRYVTDRAFAINLLKTLGCKSLTDIGETVQIADNIAPSGGGEYLTGEDLSGFVGTGGPGELKRLTVILNPGVDGSNLRSLKGLDDQKGPVLLINCGLDRLTFFDKVGMADYLDGYLSVYVLKRAANGFLFRAYPGDWQLHAVSKGQVQLLETSKARPSFVEAEKKIKAAATI